MIVVSFEYRKKKLDDIIILLHVETAEDGIYIRTLFYGSWHKTDYLIGFRLAMKFRRQKIEPPQLNNSGIF